MQIHEFQDMMRRIYFHRDSERGVDGTYNWLVDEVEELGDALKAQDMQAMRNEFADVIAWLASLANVVNIDLEASVLQKYANKCPKCDQTPCRCKEMP